MKKIVIIATLLLMSNFGFGQIQYVGSSIDARNATIGSAPTNDKPELDIVVFGGVTNKRGFTIEVGYESFKAIDFNRLYAGFGKTFISKNERWQTSVTIDGNLVTRDWRHPNWTGKQTYAAPSLTNRTTFNIDGHHGIHGTIHGLVRTDNQERYHRDRPPVVWSFYVGYTYTFARHNSKRW